MPPAIQDSDDEDEILLEEEPSQRSTFSQLANHAESVLKDFPDVLPQLDGAADKPSRSTSSSDLRRQVADAERGLLATNSDQASKHAIGMPSTTSPALQRNKRRNTTVVGSDPGISPSKSLKRVKTYAQKRTILGDEDDRPRSSVGLPAGTIGNEFLNHEPNVMFRDTGTTNAFNDSTQEELVEQARGGNNAQMAHDLPLPKAANSDKSSSFPWTASAEPTQTEKSPIRTEEQTVQPGDEVIAEKVPSLVRRPTIEPLSPVAKRPAFFKKPGDDQPEVQTDPEPPAAKTRSPPKSSPVVIIDRRAAASETNDDVATDTQKPKRGRKRKSQEALQEQAHSDDRLNSDDRMLKELGLPKENYEPRPSRRRATQVEEPLDNFLPVEKAIRKRRKTDNAAAEPPAVSQPRSQTRSRDGLYECPLGCRMRMTEEEVFSHLDQCPTKQQASQKKNSEASQGSATNGELGFGKNGEEKAKPTAKPGAPSQSPKSGSQASSIDASPSSKTLGHPSSVKKSDVGLMLPPTMPASASKKARRSKTTIFEDHVEFGGSQKSPNLSQQQAKRKAALKEVKNQSTQKSRRKIVQDDDDDEEDELAKEDEEPEELPQKKRRGRPAKASTQKPVKPTERVLKDSDAEDDEGEDETEQSVKSRGRGRPKIVLGDSDAEDDNDDLAAEEPPVKKGRGRPSKNKSKEKALQNSDAEEDAPEDEEPAVKKGRGRPAKAKSKEKVLEDSDAGEELPDDQDDDDAEPEGPPVKKRPGRPAKAKADSGKVTNDTSAKDNGKLDIPTSDLSAVNKGDSSPTKAALSRKDSNQQAKAKEMQSPPKSTPPPEKLEAKPAPATHSPIKSITKGNGSGSFPIYRVGLSKTKKIPSLLKIVGKPRPDTRR